MAKKSNTIFVIILIVVGIFLLRDSILPQSVVSGGTVDIPGGIPKGVGLGDINNPNDGPADILPYSEGEKFLDSNPIFIPQFNKLSGFTDGAAQEGGSGVHRYSNLFCSVHGDFGLINTFCSNNYLYSTYVNTFITGTGVCAYQDGNTAVINYGGTGFNGMDDYYSTTFPDSDDGRFSITTTTDNSVTSNAPANCNGNGRVNWEFDLVENDLYSPTISASAPFFFENLVNEINITTNPNGIATQLNWDGTSTDNKAHIWAWVERQVDPSSPLSNDAIALYGKSIEMWDFSRMINLKPTSEDYIFTMPSDLPVGEYDFYAIIAISGAGISSSPTGVDVQTKLVPVSDVLHKKFLINPLPLTVAVFSEASCPDGYQFQNPDEVTADVCGPSVGAQTCTCVRDDVQELACVELGCPITVDPDTGDLISYSCGSDGLCSEVVFTANLCETDLDCGPNLTCEPTSGICFNEQITTEFLQCTQAENCFDPNCKDASGEEVTASCSASGVCEYSGQCDVQLNDCTTLGCPENFLCIEDTGVCERTGTGTTTTSTGIIDEQSNTIFGLSQNQILLLIVVLVIIGILAVGKK